MYIFSAETKWYGSPTLPSAKVRKVKNPKVGVPLPPTYLWYISQQISTPRNGGSYTLLSSTGGVAFFCDTECYIQLSARRPCYNSVGEFACTKGPCKIRLFPVGQARVWGVWMPAVAGQCDGNVTYEVVRIWNKRRILRGCLPKGGKRPNGIADISR